MKVVSWNMRRSSDTAWEFLRGLAPDYALLQEVRHIPAWVNDAYSTVTKPARKKNGESQNFSTVVLSKEKIVSGSSMISSVPLVSGQLQLFGGNLVYAKTASLNLVSVYSPAWPINPATYDHVEASSIKLTTNPSLWLTDILWASLRDVSDLQSEKWIIGGDFNSSTTFDESFGSGNQEFIDRMEVLGLKDCLRQATGKLTPTFRNPKGGKIIHQMDYLYVTPNVARSLEHCSTGRHEDIFGNNISDHLPIIGLFGDNKI